MQKEMSLYHPNTRVCQDTLVHLVLCSSIVFTASGTKWTKGVVLGSGNRLCLFFGLLHLTRVGLFVSFVRNADVAAGA